MGSGRKLTKAERATILRLVAQRDSEGRWLLTYQQIADQLRLDRTTVSDCVRHAAAILSRLTARD